MPIFKNSIRLLFRGLGNLRLNLGKNPSIQPVIGKEPSQCPVSDGGQKIKANAKRFLWRIPLAKAGN